jgi:hypothetical protein
MPWDVAQNKFIRTNDVGSTGQTVWQDDKNNTPTPIKIRADRHDYHDQDLADGISACLNLDGLTTMRADLAMGSNRITGLAAGAVGTDAAIFSQVFDAMTFNDVSRVLTLSRTTGADLTATIPGGDGGGGTGTVTSIDIGEGLSGTSDPITVTGDIKLATIGTAQTISGGIDSVTIDKHGRVTQLIGGAFSNTNLAIGTRDASTLEVTSSTGTNVNLPLASTAQAGIMSASDKTTLDGLSSGGVPAILSDGATPSLNTGITGAEIRSLIGAGTGDGDGDISQVTVTAGSGLTGGGTDTTNPVSLTLNMGTPGTCTSATANGTTADSHTHALANIDAGDITSGVLSVSQGGTGVTTSTGTGSTVRNGSPTFTGTVTAPTFNATSARDKKTLQYYLEWSRAFDFVRNFAPFAYTLNDEPSHAPQLGLFADEVGDILPEAVSYDKNGKAVGIDYSRLVLPLMLVVKELLFAHEHPEYEVA